jgi:hypothetical protein
VTELDLWSDFLAAAGRYRENPCAETEAGLLAASRAFCEVFCPGHVDAVLADLRARIDRERDAA